MAFDPENPGDISRLREARRWSEQRQRTYREQNYDIIQQYVGYHAGDHGAPDRVPINLIELGVNIFQQRIRPRAVEATVSTPYRQLESGALDLELAINYQAKQVGLAEKIAECGLSAMFSGAVMKTGVAIDSDFEGDPGEFVAEPVLPEDFFWDMTAKRWDQCGFMGDRFRRPLEWVRNNPMFNRQAREAVTSADRNMGGDGQYGSEGEIDTNEISAGSGPLNDEYEESANLEEYYLPREGLKLILAADGDGMPLHIARWTGPKSGPYDMLGYGDIPGNVLKLAPARLWIDLHDITNRLFRKASRQAERQKTLLGVQGKSAEDGQRTVDADDGQAIYMEHPDGIQEFSTGGPNQQTLGMVLWSRQMLAYLGGNWDAIGGLSPQADTLGQDRLLGESSSERIKDMQDRMLNFTRRILTKMAWYLWNDPLIELPLTKPIPGTSLGIPFTWSPERRMGEFFHYNFEVEPHSARAMSPQEKADVFTKFTMQILMPALPMIAQSGISIDWEYFFKQFARYMQMPELNRLLVYMQGEQYPQRGPVMPPDAGMGGGMEMPRMPANTTRTYQRFNRPSGTRQGQDAAVMGMLFGGEGASQPSQMAGLMRGVG